MGKNKKWMVFVLFLFVAGVPALMYMHPEDKEEAMGAPPLVARDAVLQSSTPKAVGTTNRPVAEEDVTLDEPKTHNGEVSVERGKEVAKSAPGIGSPEWMIWYQKLSMEDRRSFSLAEDERRVPPEASPDQKVGMKIKSWNGAAGNSFKPVILTDYKPLLRIQNGTSTRPLLIKTVRSENGLVSSVGARLAKKGLQVNWGTQEVSEAKPSESDRGAGPVPQVIPSEMFLTSRGNEIGYKNGSKSFKTAWQAPSPNSVVFPLALDSEYRYAFGLVRRELNGHDVIDQVVVLDVMQKKVADVISIPPVEMGTNVIFDPQTEFLLVLDAEWKWMMMLDLKAAVVKSK